MKEMKIDTDLKAESRWSRFFAPIAAAVIVILVGALTYILFVTSQAVPSFP